MNKIKQNNFALTEFNGEHVKVIVLYIADGGDLMDRDSEQQLLQGTGTQLFMYRSQMFIEELYSQGRGTYAFNSRC